MQGHCSEYRRRSTRQITITTAQAQGREYTEECQVVCVVAMERGDVVMTVLSPAYLATAV